MSTQITQYGFTMGPAEVVRICSQQKWGAYLEVKGARQRVEIRVTPSGLLRVGKIITRKETALNQQQGSEGETKS